MRERDAEIVVLPDSPAFLLQLNDLVFARATACVPVREQKDEFALVRSLKMRAVNEHGEMGWVLVNDEMGKRCGDAASGRLTPSHRYHLTTR